MSRDAPTKKTKRFDRNIVSQNEFNEKLVLLFGNRKKFYPIYAFNPCRKYFWPHYMRLAVKPNTNIPFVPRDYARKRIASFQFRFGSSAGVRFGAIELFFDPENPQLCIA
jgi:hypothetical protein